MPAFFERSPSGDVFVPGDFCRGGWNQDAFHGRALAGLLAYGVEAHAPSSDWRIARLTVDMFRLAPHRPVRLRTRLLRDGNRIRSVEASLEIEDVEVARAGGLLLLASEAPPSAWGPSPPVPGPSEASPGFDASEGPFRDHRDAWEIRLVRPPGGGEAAVAWGRITHPFIEGEPTSPFVRAAATADYANPHSNRSLPRQAFINADMTLHLHRYPEGEWVGFEAAGHDSQDGVAVGACVLRDLEGPIGRCTVTALVNDRARARSSTPGVRD
jgi:hypothetical protein